MKSYEDNSSYLPAWCEIIPTKGDREGVLNCFSLKAKKKKKPTVSFSGSFLTHDFIF